MLWSLLIGCPSVLDTDTDDPVETGDTAVPTVPTVPTVPPTPADCGPAAVSVGSAGSTSTDSFDFVYTWNNTSGISVGPVVELELPAGLVSFAVSIDTPGEATGLNLLELDGDVWIDGSLFEGQGAWDTAPYYHWGVSGGTLVAPITPSTDPAGTRCMRIQAAALEDLTDEDGTLWVVTRATAASQPSIDVNVIVVGGAALSQGEIDAALAKTSQIWQSGGGPAVGSVQTYTVAGDTFLDYDDSTSLRRTVVDAARPYAMNLFFVQDYLNPDGTLGEAGGIPGPVGLQGIDEAGVIMALDAHLDVGSNLDTDLLGGTIAHEVGHQLGLFHTTEDDGSRIESLDDTPVCPASADVDSDGYFSAEECEAFDGPNFMFWASGDFVQETVSADQGWVLATAPVAR